ncbi:MAG: aminoacyl-histidine dipeptidase [Planctomycetota bacterium]
MSSALEGLKPENVWKYFGEISAIPRGSKNEAAVSNYVYETVVRLGLEAKRDAAGNVVAKKPPSFGRQEVRSVCLQGHLDMVCEKNADVEHDFSKDPIRIAREENILRAEGTTLGADNGIGVATMLAILEDKSLEHGPIECLFTVDEETGLTGASNLEPGFIESRMLINLDSEDEGVLYVGCAGGKDTVGSWKLETDPAPPGAIPAAVEVKGLCGGHSGLDIHKGRGNAIKMLGRVLLRLSELGVRLAEIHGGNKRNAIPREARAVVYLPKSRARKAERLVPEWEATLKAEVKAVDPDLSIRMARLSEGPGRVLKRGLQKRILATLSALPHGVAKMSAEIPELVETSTNVAVIGTNPEKIEVATSQRSSVKSEIDEIAEAVANVLALGGAAVEQGSGYPGWKPNLKSYILSVAKEVHERVFGKPAEVKAVHAGLECGIIGEKFPGMDMVSLGPTLEEVHTPKERIYIDTVERFWRYLLEILKTVR